jgi:hypothetical protein
MQTSGEVPQRDSKTEREGGRKETRGKGRERSGGEEDDDCIPDGIAALNMDGEYLSP